MSKTATNRSWDESLSSDIASQSSSYSKASSLSSLHSSFRTAGTFRTASTNRRRKRTPNFSDWGQSSTSSFQTAASTISESPFTTGNSSTSPKSLYYQGLAVALRKPIVTSLLEHSNDIVFLGIFGTLLLTNPLARQALDHCASVSGVLLAIWAVVRHHPSLHEIFATAEGIWHRPVAFCRALLELNTVD